MMPLMFHSQAKTIQIGCLKMNIYIYITYIDEPSNQGLLSVRLPEARFIKHIKKCSFHEKRTRWFQCHDLPKNPSPRGIAKSWRVDTVRAKMAGETDEGAIEAARRENAAWRQWHRARLREEKDEDGKLGQ